MKLMIVFTLFGLAAAASINDEKSVIIDKPLIVDESPVVLDEIQVVQDESPILDNPSPVVLPLIPEHIDIGMIMVPESVIEELKLREVIGSVRFVDNSDIHEIPVNTVHIVDFSENTDSEPIAAGELESVRVFQDEIPFEGLSPETVHVVDHPVFENLPRSYADPSLR